MIHTNDSWSHQEEVSQNKSLFSFLSSLENEIDFVLKRIAEDEIEKPLAAKLSLFKKKYKRYWYR